MLSKGLWLRLTVSTVGIIIGSGVRCVGNNKWHALEEVEAGERGWGGKSEGYIQHHYPQQELM